MLAHVLKRQRVELYTHFNDEVAEPARKGFRELVLKRAGGSPVAYLVGRKEFFSLTFAVSPDVLIPRPESEFVVTEYLALTRELEVAAVRRRRDRLGLPGDRRRCISSRGHISSRSTSASERWPSQEPTPPSSGVADRIDFRLGDRLGPLGSEVRVSTRSSANPPYIATEEIDQLEPGVKDYEPRLALDGGPGGLAMVSRLIEEAPAYLRPGGHLILEIGSAQEAPVRALIEGQPSLKLAHTVYDHANHPRVHPERPESLPNRDPRCIRADSIVTSSA